MSNQRRAQLIGLPRDALAGPLLAAIATPSSLPPRGWPGCRRRPAIPFACRRGGEGVAGAGAQLVTVSDPTVLVQQGLLNIIQGLAHLDQDEFIRAMLIDVRHIPIEYRRNFSTSFATSTIISARCLSNSFCSISPTSCSP